MDVQCDCCGYTVAIPERAGTRCNQADSCDESGYCSGIMRPIAEAEARRAERRRPIARGTAETVAAAQPATPDLPFPQPPREPRESKSDSPTPPPTSPRRSAK